MLEIALLNTVSRDLASLSPTDKRDCLGVMDAIRQALVQGVPWREVAIRFRLFKVIDAGTDLWECKKLRQLRIILLRSGGRVHVVAVYRKKGERQATRHLKQAIAVAKRIAKE